MQITQLNEKFSQKIFDLESKIENKDELIDKLEKMLKKTQSIVSINILFI